jgi:hypothetical protein
VDDEDFLKELYPNEYLNLRKNTINRLIKQMTLDLSMSIDGIKWMLVIFIEKNSI